MKIKEILTNKKVIIFVAALVLILAVVLFVRRRKRAEENDKAVAGGGETKTSGGSSVWIPSKNTSGLPEASFPLTPYSMAGEYSANAGSYGEQIAKLQKICNKKWNKNLTVDGKFGPKSEAAFLSCFGYPLAMPYSEEVYNGLIFQHGGALNS